MDKFKKHLNNIRTCNPLVIDSCDDTETAELTVCINSWPAQSRVYDCHYKKDPKIMVTCDLTKHHQNILDKACTYLKQHELKGFAYNTAECRLSLKDAHADRRYFFKNLINFKQFAANLVKDANFHKRQ